MVVLMSLKLKRLIAVICCAALIAPLFVLSASSEDGVEETDAAESAESSESEEDAEEADPDAEPRSEDEVMSGMDLAAENNALALYVDEREALFALKDKNSGRIWWSNPINADISGARSAQLQELKTALTIKSGEPAARRTRDERGRAKFKKISGGIEAEYDFSNAETKVPVIYVLEEDHLRVTIKTSEIKEENPGKIITVLTLLSTFGAADETEEGYFVVPDGSGALINFNNGKSGYKEYSGKVYGEDITAVKTTKPAKLQPVYLPMFGIVKGDSAIMAVADKGDAAATINAYVSGQKSRVYYNYCYFSFDLRTTDQYLMGGDSNPLTVFENHGILIPEIEVRYYPFSSSDGSDVDYTDVAAKYREYLIRDKGVTKSQHAGNVSLYADFYGGTLKNRSILGVPIKMSYAATEYNDARRILGILNDKGVDRIVSGYNQWTADDIKNNVVDSVSPAGLLGGKKDFNSLLDYSAQNNISLYPFADNLTFNSGNGYFTFSDTAVRVSTAFSRQIKYDLAHGVENRFYKPLSLLSPASFDRVFSGLSESYVKYGLENIGVSSLSSAIYGDYGRKAISREKTKEYLIEGFKKLDENVGSVMAREANAYLLPYVDHISKVTLSSGKHDAFDADIPFYQLVMHGLKPYSTKAVNGSPRTADTILRAIAAGSCLSFDFTGATADDMKDTEYDSLYYADYRYWTDDAAGAYKLSKDILGDVSDKYITGYNVSEHGLRIETVYEDGTVIEVDLENDKIIKNGEEHYLYDYIAKGALG